MQAYKGMCYVPLNRVWFSRSWVFRVYNFTIKRLEQGVFLDWKPFRVCVSCLKQGNEMSNFCVNQGRGLKVSAAQLYPDFLWVPPPGKVRKFDGNWREGTASEFREWKFTTLPFWLSTVLVCVAGAKRRRGGGGDKSAKGKRESLTNPLPFSLSPNTPAYQVETLKFNMTASLRGDKQRKWG